MRSRALIIYLGFIVVWFVLISRAALLQVLPQPQLQRLQEKQFETVINLQPRRGDILDRTGKELASSVTMYSVYADPQLISEARKISQKLSRILGIPQKTILKKLKKNSRFVWLARRESKFIRDKILALKERGLGLIEEPQRVYPNGKLLSHILGFVGRDNQGLAGLEHRFHEELAGKNRVVNFLKDARGRPLLQNGRIFSQKPGGSNLILTVDLELQYFLEQELEKAISEHNAKGGTGIVLNVSTSEILALSSSPRFDPNNPTQFSASDRKNRTITDVFEPGSTLKTFTAALALENNLAKPNTNYYCENGEMKIGRLKIGESSKDHKWGWLTLSQILEVSSNIGIVKVASEIGQKKLEAGLRSFGFGEKLGIELGGEQHGIIPARPWREHHFATISFGQGIAVTALQMANAYAAIANGGHLMRPFLVKRIENHETGERREFHPRQIRKVLSEENAERVRMMLVGATGGTGTGAAARVPGYVVAGKTGTAQVVDTELGGYARGDYIASFAGFIPANNPEYVIFISIDRPQNLKYTGGQIAAPVFSRVASFLARRSGIPPILISREDLIKQPEEAFSSILAKKIKTPIKSDGTMPDLKGLTAREVIDWVKRSKTRSELIGEGKVRRTTPEPGVALNNSKKIKIYLE